MSDSDRAAYEPLVLALCCTYCAYTAADLAGSLRLQYSPNVRVLQLPCSGKVDAVLLLHAFERGADAVYVAGCAEGDCHFVEGNLRGKNAVGQAKLLLVEVGIEAERLEFFHIPASAGALFAQRADEMVERARRLGPNPLRARSGRTAGRRLDKPSDSGPALPSIRLGELIRREEGSA